MYFRGLLVTGALAVLFIAYLFTDHSFPPHEPYIQGRNKTVLFLTNTESGLSNVHVATASALLENYPDIEVHYATFPGSRERLERASKFARSRTPAARDITFHALQGPTFVQAGANAKAGLDGAAHPPASRGMNIFMANFQQWLALWSIEEHMDLYHQMDAIINEVDPAVIVLDTFFSPGFDITRDKNRLHAIITPNMVSDNFVMQQPYGGMFWKYPVLGSGFTFPVPLYNIPENIYLNLRLIYTAITAPTVAAKRKGLSSHGVKDPTTFLGIYRADVPWITMNTEGASIPVDVVPKNVSCAGPILLSAAPAKEQDPELAEWLKQAPTILVNLGSLFIYTERHLQEMAGGLAKVLSETSFQVIWKIQKESNRSEGIFAPLKPYIDAGRLRVPTWLTPDISSLLETGDIVASVHHGGSNCFYETVTASVPHVILPMWADHYTYAALAETLGIGTWACKGTNPDWTAGGISTAILSAVDGGEFSILLQNNAKRIGEKIRASEQGRDVAAREISKLAYKK